MKRKFSYSLIFAVAFLSIFPCASNVAAYLPENILDLHIDTPTLTKGYTVTSQNNQFYLGLRPEVLAVETRIVVKQYSPEQFTYPQGLAPVSQVYEFDIFNKQAFQDEKPLMFKFITDKPTNNYKQLYFYNGVLEEWVFLPSESFDEQTVRGIIHLPYAKLVILESDIMQVGAASWYAYKNCDCAASPDYPKGTKLRVKNLENNSEVTVTVNDYGPDRSLHPERVIDLDKVAFLKLGKLWQGILPRVIVEKVE